MINIHCFFILELSMPLLLNMIYLASSHHGSAESSAIQVSGRLWRRSVHGQEGFQRDTGIVYYQMDPFLPNGMRKLIVRQIKFFNDLSCIKWYQLFPWEDDQYYKLTFTFGEKDNRCWYASSNRSDGDGKTDVIWLGEWCAQTLYSSGEGRLRSVIQYLMMNALGLYNEHQRSNRDCWLQLDGTLSKEISFHKLANESFFSDFPYDYISAMHYPSWAVRGMHSRQKDLKQLGRQDGDVSFQDYQQLSYLSCYGPSYCQSLQAGPEGVDGWRESCKTVLQTEQSRAGQEGCAPNIFPLPERYFDTFGLPVVHQQPDPTEPQAPDVVSEPVPIRPCYTVCEWKQEITSNQKYKVCKCHTT